MSKHPNYCPSFNGTLEQQAEEIDNLTHEAKRILFQRLYELSIQREQQETNRPKYLSYLSGKVSPGLRNVVEGEERCWIVCKRYTETITKNP